jgi:tetratricopeptide (TPR) repeat protein
MTFEEILDQALAMLQRRGRVTYRALKLQFTLDDDQLEALKDELLYAHPQAVDDAGRGLLWTGSPVAAPPPAAALALAQDRAPLSYTPPHLAERILTSRAALEGERKQVTVLFADLKGSMELLADRDPEEARTLAEGALAHARGHQGRGNQAYALRRLGDIAARREASEREQAETYYRQALALTDELGMRPLQAHCHRGLGTLYAKIGRREQACAELATAIDLYRTMGMTFWLPQAEATLAQVEGR